MKTNLLLATMLTAGTAMQIMAQVMIPDGTKLRVRLEQNLTSETAELGQTVDFSVTQEVRVGDAVVVTNGARATGSVIKAEPKRRMGRSGQLDFTIERVQMVDGNWLSVRYTPVKNRGKNNGIATGALTAGLAVAFLPAAPLGLLIKGKDATIIKGRTYEVFADESTYVASAVAASAPPVTRVLPQAPIQTLRMTNGGVANNGGLPPGVNVAANPVLVNNTSTTNTMQMAGGMQGGAGGAATLSINANHPGADIEIDGMFVGNAPTTLQVPAGVHQVVLRHGSSVWQRNLQVTSGTVTINATLGTRAAVQRAGN